MWHIIQGHSTIYRSNDEHKSQQKSIHSMVINVLSEQ